MNTLDFYSNLVSDMTGVPREKVKKCISELEKYVENKRLLDSDISQENMTKILEAVKTDPQTFLNWLIDGQIEGFGRITLH